MIKSSSRIFVIFALLAVSSSALSADEGGIIPRLWKKFTAKKGAVVKPDAAPAPKAPAPEMPRSEMIERIKYDVEMDEGVLEKLPQLKVIMDDSGARSYKYMQDGKEIGLEDLDDARLRTLMDNVSDQTRAHQAGIVNNQLQMIAEAQRASAMQAQIPRPTPTPPQPPRTPPQPPQQPRR